MKSASLIHVGLSWTVTVLFSAVGFAQGTLTPPGAPAPTMRTLDQIEPRTIVNAANTPGDATNLFIIAKAGSYYLSGNITGDAGKNGISIQAGDVTLDLNGFTLTGPGTGGTSATGLRGVATTVAATNSCLRNGSLRNWYCGAEASAAGMLVDELRLSGNITGLSMGNGSIARACVATGNTTGLLGDDRTQFEHCIATENSGAGFDCAAFVDLLDCTSSRNGTVGFRVKGSCSLLRCGATRNNSTGAGLDIGCGISSGDGCIIAECTAGNNAGIGIRTTDGCSVVHCTASGNGGSGTSTGEGCSVSDCTLSKNAGNGVTLRSGNTIRNCTAYKNQLYGIYCDGFDCHVVGNTCDANANGIWADAARIDSNSCTDNTGDGFSGNSLLIRNSAERNGVNYGYGPSGPKGGPIEDVSAGGHLSGSPWANFSY